MKKTIVIDASKTAKKSISVKKGEEVTVGIIALNTKQKEGNFTVKLTGKGARATIVGIVIGAGENYFNLHTRQIHEAPQTTSDLLIKSILSGRATFTYDGQIRVEKIAQKTDAYQRNENLLLSDSAHARSDPTLEILANDVRCTHGATVGTVSKEELWYLASRGIGQTAGRELIVAGFVESALNKISDTMVRENVRSRLWQILSKQQL